MSHSREGSTTQLVQFCLGYFSTYTVFSVLTKWFTEYPDRDTAVMKDLEYTVYTTIGGMAICLVVVIALGWYRLASNNLVRLGGLSFPREFFYIIPSGVCTAVVIPTTTLMYTLPISVMVAMVIMRGIVIVVGRVVDAIQIRQGILHKQVYWQENVAVVFAVAAVSTTVFLANSTGTGKGGSFDFVTNTPAMTILGAYVLAYSIRIYIMNYYKNTRPKGVKQDNKGFFAVEQIAATVTVVLAAIFVFFLPGLLGWTPEATPAQIAQFRDSLITLKPNWGGAVLAGGLFGVVAFFSVFLFMFKGRTATFAGLVNRLTSLIAGTAATVTFWAMLGGKAPKLQDWVSLGMVLIAVAFLSVAERRRAAELEATHELDTPPAPATPAPAGTDAAPA